MKEFFILLFGGAAIMGVIWFVFAYDNQGDQADLLQANSRATENKIEALENRLAGQIALSESRIQSEIEKSRIIAKHNTEKVIFVVTLIAVVVCAFVVMIMSFFWILSIIRANNREADLYRLQQIRLQSLDYNPTNHERLPAYRERG
jgi:hypothetical protein